MGLDLGNFFFVDELLRVDFVVTHPPLCVGLFLLEDGAGFFSATAEAL